MLGLIYRSQQLVPHWPSVLLDIMRECNRRNLDLGVTGMLLCGHQGYVQYIEGPDDAINIVWRLIAADPRHRIEWQETSPVSELRLPNLTMGYFDTDHEKDPLLPDLAGFWGAPAAQSAAMTDTVVALARAKYPSMFAGAEA